MTQCSRQCVWVSFQDQPLGRGGNLGCILQHSRLFSSSSLESSLETAQPSSSASFDFIARAAVRSVRSSPPSSLFPNVQLAAAKGGCLALCLLVLCHASCLANLNFTDRIISREPAIIIFNTHTGQSSRLRQGVVLWIGGAEQSRAEQQRQQPARMMLLNHQFYSGWLGWVVFVGTQLPAPRICGCPHPSCHREG